MKRKKIPRITSERPGTRQEFETHLGLMIAEAEQLRHEIDLGMQDLQRDFTRFRGVTQLAAMRLQTLLQASLEHSIRRITANRRGVKV